MGTLAKEPESQKRGFIFSVDTMAALFVSLILVLAAYAVMLKAQPDTSAYDAQRVAAGLLASLEKGGDLALAINTSSTGFFAGKLGALPSSMCGRLTVRDSAGSPVLSSSTDCMCVAQKVIAKRSVAIAGATPAFYIAELEVCGK